MRRAVLVVLGLTAACASTSSAKRSDAPPPHVPTWAPSAPPASLPELTRGEPATTVQVMPNGLRVVVVEHHRRPLVSLRLIFPSGAADDDRFVAGATYFALGTLLGRYDEKDDDGYPRDPMEKSARRLVAELGAALTFDVTADTAWVGVNGFATDTSRYLTQLQQIVTEPRRGELTFGALIDSVTDQLNELEVSDSEVLENHLGRIAFGEGSTYARPIYGTPSSLSHLGIEDVAARQQQLLNPAGATLLIAGDVTPEAVFKLTRRTLGAWRPRTHRVAPTRRATLPRASKRKHVTFLPRTGARTTLVCAARRFDDAATPPAALALVAQVLGERLDRSLREQLGLTYGAWAAHLRHRGASALLACTRLDATQTEAGLKAFLAGLESLRDTEPTDDEVETARAQLVTAYASSLDTLDRTLHQYEWSVGVGESVSPAKRIAGVRAVSLADARSLAKDAGELPVFQLVVSGESVKITPVLRQLKLGPLRVPSLDRVETTE